MKLMETLNTKHQILNKFKIRNAKRETKSTFESLKRVDVYLFGFGVLNLYRV